MYKLMYEDNQIDMAVRHHIQLLHRRQHIKAKLLKP